MKLVAFSFDHPKTVIAIMVLATLALAPFIPSIQIDTDPENMLPYDEPVRVFHRQMKSNYDLSDIIVVGVVNESHPEGVFNVESLTHIYEVNRFIETLREEQTAEETVAADRDDMDAEEQVQSWIGVVPRDLMAPANMDHIEPAGPGVVSFDWLMPKAPSNEAEALEIRDRLMGNDMFLGTIVSEDGRALCLYVPITSKDLAHKIAKEIESKTSEYGGDDRWFITGLPVAEDTFGIEMFIQMATTAPAAMGLIFVLMLVFFRKVVLIISPLIIAMVSVLLTMGLLIATGNTVHIMSSMIPIFIMPIAVLDSIHLLSEFFDRYPEIGDRRRTVLSVMQVLMKPMLFTSLTSAAGFGSLALTPIPPVQVFGIFVAFGIIAAWLLTITFIPAYIALLSEKRLTGFGRGQGNEGATSLIERIVRSNGLFAARRPKVVVLGTLVLIVVAGWGITKIEINDNPVRWFRQDHPIRVADRVLNEHFGGTYMAYLALSQDENAAVGNIPEAMAAAWTAVEDVFEGQEKIVAEANQIIEAAGTSGLATGEEILSSLVDRYYEIADESEGDTQWAWEDLASATEVASLSLSQPFKRPDVIEYLDALDEYLVGTGLVGKVNGLPKIVKKINKELHDGSEDQHRVPNNLAGVGQVLLSYQNSHVPERLFHCTLRDYTGVNLWLQLKSGDNRDMELVVAAVDRYFEENPPPTAIDYDWFGLTWINVVWQQRMVAGMGKAFLGSFVVVFLMMTLLFRSPLWGALSMIPLTFTILFVYGVIGLVGKDYDMPVAVLSSLALGLAVDFGIHFLSRAREMTERLGSWSAALEPMFQEPARAIQRNVIVIAVGFLPLLFATLVPYQTVGLLLASILLLSGFATLVLLPALITLLERQLMPQPSNPEGKP